MQDRRADPSFRDQAPCQRSKIPHELVAFVPSPDLGGAILQDRIGLGDLGCDFIHRQVRRDFGIDVPCLQLRLVPNKRVPSSARIAVIGLRVLLLTAYSNPLPPTSRRAPRRSRALGTQDAPWMRRVAFG